MDAAQETGRKIDAGAGTRLYFATKNHDLAKLSEAIAQGASVSGLNFENRGMEMTPLMVAARFSNEPACRALLAAGAKIDEVDPDGWTAIDHAACDADRSTIEALLDADAAGAADGARLLFRACEGGNIEAARLMLARGVAPTARFEGLDAMMGAADLGNVECAVAVLIAGGDPSARGPGGLTAVEICRASGHDAEADELAAAIAAYQERQLLAGSIAPKSGAARPPRASSL